MPKTKIPVSEQNSETKELKELIAITTKLWRKYHLTYDQAGYVSKEVRRSLGIKRIPSRKTSFTAFPAMKNKN